MRRIEFSEKAGEEYLYWARHNRAIADRIDELLEDMRADPFKGKGKPKALKGNLQGYWSRRITQEHRIMYRVKGDLITVYFCRGRYE
jgi:toxin YoeB